MSVAQAYRENKWEWALVLGCLLLCYFPLCHHIDSYCIRVWDESRNAVNALELMRNGDLLIRYFEGKPDMYELKPPLLVWLQALSMKIFGVNETALRIPSMLFSMGTVLLLLRISKISTGHVFAGILAAISLVSINGYTRDHVSRTGDHDVLLAFFSTAFVFCSFVFAQSGKRNYLYWALLVFFLGWFTKSIAIFMFLPGIFAWFLLDKKLERLFKSRGFWLGSLGLFLLMALYYWYRESRSPGYMQEVWKFEWFGRYLDYGSSIRSDTFDPFFYLKGFFKDRFTPFILLVFAGTAYVLFDRKLPQRKFMLFLLLQFYFYLLVISMGTKNFWYDAPLFPIAALFMGLLARDIALKMQNAYWRSGVVVLFLSLFVLRGYASAIKHVMSPDGNKVGETESLSYFLKEEKKLPSHFTVVFGEHASSLYFYKEKLKGKADIKVIKFYDMRHFEPLQVGDTALMTTHIRSFLKEYVMEILVDRPGCALVVIK